MKAKLDELCELTHFPKDGLDRYPVELSGGQRQRVSLMRALVLDPDVLRLEEPLGALDPMVRASLQTELKEIFVRLGKTVILVTHDMAEAGYLSDSIVKKAGRADCPTRHTRRPSRATRRRIRFRIHHSAKEFSAIVRNEKMEKQQEVRCKISHLSPITHHALRFTLRSKTEVQSTTARINPAACRSC